MTQKLIDAANAVIARWDSPQWNWGEPTAGLIHELREAVVAAEVVDREAFLRGYQAAYHDSGSDRSESRVAYIAKLAEAAWAAQKG